jgi:hypothetical protein
MIRALSVLVAVLVLLGVGWFLGHRPVARLERDLQEKQAELQAVRDELTARISAIEARGLLHSAHAELLMAASDAERRNFGDAAGRADHARELITRAAAAPGVPLPLDPVRDLLESAREGLDRMDADAIDLLKGAASELNRILNRLDQA